MTTGRGRSRALAVRVAGGSELTVWAGDAVERWVRYLASDYGASTASTYAAGLRRFRTWLAEQGLELVAVAPVDVRRFRDEMKEKFAAASVSNWQTAIRRFYAWMIEEGAPIANPASDVRGPRGSAGRKSHKRDALTDSEVCRLFAACDGDDTAVRDRGIFGLIGYCGLRQIEVQRADLKHLDSRDGRQVLWIHGKGAASASVYAVLPPAAEMHLADWLAERGVEPGPLFPSMSRANAGERLSGRALRAIWGKRKRQAKISGVHKTLHSLRHSAITKAIRAGGEPMAVQAMARHKSFDTTLIYYHEISRTERPAEDLIRYGGAGEAGQRVLEGF